MQAERAATDATLDRGVRAIVRRWAGIVSVLIGVYAALPWLSPLLRSLGL